MIILKMAKWNWLDQIKRSAGAKKSSRILGITTDAVGNVAVLSHDPTSVEPAYLREIEVEQTFVDGRRLYDFYGR